MRRLFILDSAIHLAWGLLFVLLPTTFGTALGLNMDAAAIALSRCLGALHIGIAALSWWFRDEDFTPARHAVFKAQSVGWGLSFLMSLQCMLSGLWSVMGKANTLLMLAGTLAWGYLAWFKPEGP
jgi:hypothetical protein